MQVGNVLGATEIPRNGPARRDHLALVSATVEDVLVDGNYHANFVRLGSKVNDLCSSHDHNDHYHDLHDYSYAQCECSYVQHDYSHVLHD